MNKISNIIIFLLILNCSFYASAANIPWVINDRINLTVKDMKLKPFLETIFSTQKIPIRVSPDISENILSGKFKGSAESIFLNIKNTYGLLTFYDGQIVHVTLAAHAQIKTLPLSTGVAHRAIALINQLGLPDLNNTLTLIEDEEIIILKGSPYFIEICEELVRPLTNSIQNTPLSIKMFPLKYAWAHDVTLNFGGKQTVIPGLVTILRSLVVGDVPQNRSNERLLKTTQEKLRGKGLKAIGNEEFEKNTNLPSLTQKGDMTASISSVDSTTQVRIEVNQRLNAIVVRDTPNRMPYYKQLIELLDKEPALIEIEAQIIDVKVDKSLGLGVNWRRGTSAIDLLFSGSSSGAKALTNALKPSDLSGSSIGFSASTLVGDRNSFVARISAMESRGTARIVARPKIITLGNVEAVLENSSSFYVRVAGFNDVDLFNVTSGTTLRVTPHVLLEGDKSRIQMLINIEDGNLTSQTVDKIPVIERSSLNTQALINEGQSLLIGGMVRVTTSKQTKKVPLLGDLPFVGVFFRETQQLTSRVERLFLITPHLVKNKTYKHIENFSDKNELPSSNSNSLVIDSINP